MPTTKIISREAPKPQEIDWSKKQFLKSINAEAIVYSTGKHGGDYFEAWCYSGRLQMQLVPDYLKSTFLPLQGKVQLEISNEED